MTEEWPAGLDVNALRLSGWRPIPFRQFVLKISSRCNLSCDYCYMYTMADQDWRSQPRLMAREVVVRVAQRIADHASRHGLPSAEVVLHGGEPLLAGGDALAAIARILHAAVPSGTDLHICLQTNGTLLDEPTLRRLADADIGVAVSLDGAPDDHDRHRRGHDGSGSYAATAAGLALLASEPFRRLFAGLLCVVDLRHAPVTTYEALLAYSPPMVDFLLPHGTWSRRPVGRDRSQRTPYGDWLVQVFDRWYGAPRQETKVRLFAEIMNLVLGGESSSDQVGLSPAAMLVFNVNGGIEQVDTLRAAHATGPSTAMTVFDNDLDEVLAHPAIVARQIGALALAETCRRCPVGRVCGGGHYAHRYRRGSGFRNPSVYCADLARLIRHISGLMRADVAWLRESIR